MKFQMGDVVKLQVREGSPLAMAGILYQPLMVRVCGVWCVCVCGCGCVGVWWSVRASGPQEAWLASWNDPMVISPGRLLLGTANQEYCQQL